MESPPMGSSGSEESHPTRRPVTNRLSRRGRAKRRMKEAMKMLWGVVLERHSLVCIWKQERERGGKGERERVEDRG